MTYKLTQDHTLAIKGIAIIAMLLHHLFFEHPEYGFFTHQVGLVGKVCVALFLFASGYGLTTQFHKTTQNVNINQMGGVIVNFLYRRFVKFYLNYWPIFIIFVPIGIFYFNRTLDIPYGQDANIYKYLIKDLLAINEFESYNITWWFNKLILTLYLVFPLLYILVSANNKYITTLFLIFSYLKLPYYFPFILGLAIAYNIDHLDNMLNHLKPSIIFTISIGMTLILILSRQFSPIPKTNGLYLDGIISLFTALSVVTATQLFHISLPVLRFLGRHSMNIYLIHTFIFYYFFPDFIYGFHYPILIFAALLATSLLTSIALEQLKRITHYNSLIPLLQKIHI